LVTPMEQSMTKMSSALRTSGSLKRGVNESIHAVAFFSAEYATRPDRGRQRLECTTTYGRCSRTA
jgi:hypothetical protein